MNVPTKRTTPKPAVIEMRTAIVAVMKKYGDKLDAQEILALLAHMVGQAIALQDQRKMTRDMALQIVIENIEQGNQEVLDGLGYPERDLSRKPI